MKELYPILEPLRTHRFKRGIHELYVEECGSTQGIPVIFLHGGPGSGCKPHHRGFFDPDRYRVILLDQRGAGRSKPQGGLEENSTQHLLDDLDFIRGRLRVGRWLIFAGSWGATLGLLSAQRDPGAILGMILRGSFLARSADLGWFAGGGTQRVYPDRWEQLMAHFPEDEQLDPIAALYRRLIGRDELAQRRAAREWAQWSGQVALGDEFEPDAADAHVSLESLNQARIELHYAVNRYFIEENQVLDGCETLADVPTILVHGRRDLVCPVDSSFLLHRRLPKSELRVIAGAGHVAAGARMIDALVQATDDMADRIES